MAIYFGVLKKEVVYSKIKSQIIDGGMKVLRYYPKLRVVKFEADGLPVGGEVAGFFDSIEEEKTDFSI